MAKDAGIDISGVAREALRKEHEALSLTNAQQSICAKNANVPSGTLAQLAQNTFSDKLRREDIPSYLWPVMDSQSDTVGCDNPIEDVYRNLG